MQSGADPGQEGIDNPGFTGEDTAAVLIEAFLEKAIRDIDHLMPACDRQGVAERAAEA